MQYTESLDLICDQLQQSQLLLNKFIQNTHNLYKIHEAAEVITEALRHHKKILCVGNGGSMSDAMHFAAELSGKYRMPRPPFAALALSDPAALSCISNDFGYEHSFDRQVYALGRPEDVLLALTTSGSSKNIVNAVKTAKGTSMSTIVLTGGRGSEVESTGCCDVIIKVPHFEFADKTQEMHIKIIHILVMLIEKELTPQS